MLALNDTQLVLLSAAASRNDHILLPIPESIKTPKVPLAKTIENLIARGYVEEREADLAREVWRETNDGLRLTLAITTSGMRAIGIFPDLDDKDAENAALVEDAPTAAPDIGTSKISKANQVIALLRKAEGATVASIQEITGWQAHSVRGFLSGLRKRNLNLQRTQEGKGAVYRIMETVA